MIEFLARLFIKHAEDTSDPEVRRAYGTLCSVVAIVLNALLFAAKLIIGRATGSVTIRADAMNNLTDAGSAVLILVTFKLAGQKPSPERPFGHGRIEYVSGMIVAAIILVLGVEFARESIGKILHPEALDTTTLAATIVILLLSIAVKFCMGMFSKGIGKRIDSAALKAAGAENMTDTVTTFAALVSLLIYALTPRHCNLDGWFGILVSLLIIKAGVESAWETLGQLLGRRPDPELVKQVEDICRSYPEIVGVHDLVIHDYGPGRLMISLHAEVPGNGDIYALHDAMDRAMAELDTKLGCESVIHMDPICTDDEKVVVKRTELSAALAKLGDGVTIHDFRMVTGPTHTNVIFDCVIPYELKLTEEEAKTMVKEAVASLWDNTYAIVKIDRPYV